MTKTSVDARAVAALLAAALRSGEPIVPVRDLIGDDIDAAYRVQAHMIRELGQTNPRVGRKVGLTSPAVQTQLGVDQPDFGVLLQNMRVANGESVRAGELIAPRTEAEVAFVMRDDVTRADRASVVAAVEYATAAVEIVDSRIVDWDISIVDTVADNASSARFVLGDRRLTLDEFDPRAVQMTMSINGSVVSAGSGQACLGDPVNALVWVAQTALQLGEPLRAGEVVLSGALGPMAPLKAGDHVIAQLDPLGTVEFAAERGDET